MGLDLGLPGTRIYKVSKQQYHETIAQSREFHPRIGTSIVHVAVLRKWELCANSCLVMLCWTLAPIPTVYRKQGPPSLGSTIEQAFLPPGADRLPVDWILLLW